CLTISYYVLGYYSLINFFFFNDPHSPKIYTLSLHDALPIYHHRQCRYDGCDRAAPPRASRRSIASRSLISRASRAAFTSRTSGKDRKSTRLNSSHDQISYAVFCLKKKKKKNQ